MGLFYFFLSCSCGAAKAGGQVFGQLDFKLIVEPADSPSFTVVLLAPSRQEKAAWTSDISQVMGKHTHRNNTIPQNSESASPSGIGKARSKHRRCPGSPGVSLAHVFTNKVAPFLRDKKNYAQVFSSALIKGRGTENVERCRWYKHSFIFTSLLCSIPVLSLCPLQCIDNIRCNGLMTSVFEENSKVTVPHMIK